MHQIRKYIWVAFALSGLVWTSAAAQAKKPMTLLDMLNVPRLTDPQLSPDGGEVLFVLSQADWKANRRISHIWRLHADGKNQVRMTNGKRGENSPRWSPDGRQFAFLSRRSSSKNESGGKNQIYLIQNAGGEANQLSHHATSVSRMTWAPGGEAIYFLAEDAKNSEEKERDKQKDDVFAFDENYKQRHLWKITLQDGEEHKITTGDFSVTGYDISEDGKRIVLGRAPSPLFGDLEHSEVFVMDSDGGEATRLTRNGVAERNIKISPDSTRILFTAGANQQFETYYNGNLFVVPVTGGKSELLRPDLPYGVDAASWSPNGKSIVLLCNMGVHRELFELDVATRKMNQLTDGRHALGGWTLFEKNKQHLFTVNRPDNPGEVYMMGMKQPVPQRVTRVFEYLVRDFELPRAEKIQWKGSDGVPVEGILTYPLHYVEGKKYPLVVNTHGGPAASDKMTFSSWSKYIPVLAAKGYAVLQPNYRGSTGYGNDFLRDMVGHYFRQSHLDVMTGVDYLIDRGIADPDHLIKMGWSGGGHMTNKIITFTDRFKAASSGAGAANWISMYAQSDVRTYRTPWFGGTPWQKDAPISVYWNHSPLKDVWKVKTPTIFLVGEKDVRVPMPQSVEMYRALKSLGVPTHLYVAPREPHGWRELRHELYKMNIELTWFEKYAMGRNYSWEKAPRAPQHSPEGRTSRND